MIPITQPAVRLWLSSRNQTSAATTTRADAVLPQMPPMWTKMGADEEKRSADKDQGGSAGGRHELAHQLRL